jgi:hypothetical protein
MKLKTMQPGGQAPVLQEAGDFCAISKDNSDVWLLQHCQDVDIIHIRTL